MFAAFAAIALPELVAEVHAATHALLDAASRLELHDMEAATSLRTRASMLALARDTLLRPTR